MHGACTKQLYFHFWSIIWRHDRVPRPRFPRCGENYGDSRTLKADIGLLNICMVSRTSWPKMVFFGGGGKIEEGVVRYRPPPQRTRSYFSGFLRLCQFWWKSIKKCDRESARRRTDRLTHTQTQTDFIISPMLYAIAMGQITIQQESELTESQSSLLSSSLHITFTMRRLQVN